MQGQAPRRRSARNYRYAQYDEDQARQLEASPQLQELITGLRLELQQQADQHAREVSEYQDQLADARHKRHGYRRTIRELKTIIETQGNELEGKDATIYLLQTENSTLRGRSFEDRVKIATLEVHLITLSDYIDSNIQ